MPTPDTGPSEAGSCTFEVRKASGALICYLENLCSTTTGRCLHELIAMEDGIPFIRKRLLLGTSEIGFRDKLSDFSWDTTVLTVVYVTLASRLQSDDAVIFRQAIWALAQASNAEILEFVRNHGVSDIVPFVDHDDSLAQEGALKVIRRLLELDRLRQDTEDGVSFRDTLIDSQVQRRVIAFVMGMHEERRAFGLRHTTYTDCIEIVNTLSDYSVHRP